MNVLRKSALARRTFIRGAGASLALPWLEAMRPGRALAANQAQPPRRLVFVYVPNGVIMKDWTPQGEGRNFALSQTLQPLSAFKDDILVVSGLSHRNAEALGDGPGDHARASATYLTGVHPKKSATDVRVGISVDQLAAKAIGNATRLPSLELSCDRGQLAGSCDSGYSCAYQNAFSWRSENTPLPAEVNPRFVFERLFGAAGNQQQGTQRLQRDQSLLDFVAQDAKRLASTLGSTDKRKLDEYLTSVRAVEQQIQHSLSQPPAKAPKDAKRPAHEPANFEDHLRHMSDLLVLALQTDSTRIATLVFGRELSNRTFPWLGAHSGHHDTSHHQNNAEKIATLSRIDKFHVERLAYLLNRLKDTPEAEGNLLDHCLLVYGSGLSDGNRHLHNQLPTIVAGRGGGSLDPGRHLQAPEGTPMCNLWVSLLQRMGVNAPQFGDSTGALSGLQVAAA